MASVQLKHIFKRYPNGFEAVKDFNLDIEDKEFIIFVGPSETGRDHCKEERNGKCSAEAYFQEISERV